MAPLLVRWIDAAFLNVVFSALLALAVWVILSRVRARPTLAHALWLTVLLKLVMPPVVELAIVPSLGRPSTAGAAVPTPLRPLDVRPGLPLSISGRSSPATVDPTAGGGDPAPAPSTNPAPSLAALLAFVWLAGVVTVLSLAVARAVALGACYVSHRVDHRRFAASSPAGHGASASTHPRSESSTPA